ncbi:MAG TPA: HlyD family efflux transporter periplasmic adaptor subunit [Burkholderiales bacterium]
MSPVSPEVQENRRFAQGSALAHRTSDAAWARFAQAQTPEEFCSSWLLIQCEAIGGVSDGVVLLQKPGSEEFVPVGFFPDTAADRSHLAEVSERALSEGRGVVLPRELPGGEASNEPRYQLAYPVRLEGKVRGAVGLEMDWRSEPQLQEAMRHLQWGSGWLEVLLRRHADPMDAARLRLKMALDLVATLLGQPGLKESGAGFVTELATRLGCDRVALGTLKGKRVKLAAVSHSAQFDERANLLRAVEGAMEEAVDQAEVVMSPPARENLPVVSHAHDVLLRESGAVSAVSFPLRSDDKVVGALTFERSAGYRFDAPTLELCEAVAAIAGPIVELKRRGEEGLLTHAAGSTAGLWKKLVGPGHPGLKLTALLTTAAALFLAFATGDFRVSADVTVEGAVQRAVTAPFNGFVREAPLRAGDTVKAGQVIGRLEDRELQLERVKVVSQRDQFDRQHREAMAKRDRAQIEIIGAQISQAEAQLALIEEQLARTAMTAPFDSVIVSGDLSQSLGSPVERGQVLFELAPLDGYRIVLKVDERDIAHVALGQRGELAVTAMPGEPVPFTVTSITPVNLAEEGRNYFRVEARVEGEGARLRPGMAGVGKIYVEERKLVWIWTRTLTDWVRLTLWSWLP